MRVRACHSGWCVECGSGAERGIDRASHVIMRMQEFLYIWERLFMCEMHRFPNRLWLITTGRLLYMCVWPFVFGLIGNDDEISMHMNVFNWKIFWDIDYVRKWIHTKYFTVTGNYDSGVAHSKWLKWLWCWNRSMRPTEWFQMMTNTVWQEREGECFLFLYAWTLH